MWLQPRSLRPLRRRRRDGSRMPEKRAVSLNAFLTCVSGALAGFAAFGFFTANEGDPYRLLITAGAGLSLFVALGGVIALSSSNTGLAANLRVASVLFFIALAVVQITYSVIGVSFPSYIIITGTLMTAYILVCYVIVQKLG